MEMKIFSGNSVKPMVQRVCDYRGMPLGQALVGRFADGEVRVEIEENVRNCDVYIVGSTHTPYENVLELRMLAQAAFLGSAARITLVVPYLGYNRQDVQNKPRTPITAQMIIQDLATSGAHGVVLFDLHSKATLGGFLAYKVIPHHLYASHASIDRIVEILGDEPFVVAATDAGGVGRAKGYAKLLRKRYGKVDMAIFDKQRVEAGVVDEDSIQIIGNVKDRNVLLVDDMFDTGGTGRADAKAAKKAGANQVLMYTTHALCSNDAVSKLDDDLIDGVIVTDSVPHAPGSLGPKVEVVSLDKLIADVTWRLNTEASLSDLFF